MSQVTPQDIVRLTALAFRLPQRALINAGQPVTLPFARQPKWMRARNVAVWLIDKHTSVGRPLLMNLFGVSSVSAIGRIINSVDDCNSPELADLIELIDLEIDDLHEARVSRQKPKPSKMLKFWQKQAACYG
jgi:hypothetical protein